MQVTVRLKLKVDTTYYAQRSIYRNIEGGVYSEPVSLAELESIMWMSRNHLEIELRDARLKIPEIMKVFVTREDEVRGNKFVVLYPEIGLNPLGPMPDGIILYIANPQNPTPHAKRIMEEWRLRKWFETKDPTYLGFPAPIDYNTMFDIKEVDWSHYKGI